MRLGKKKSLKQTLKFLSLCKSPYVISKVIANSPDSLVKAICNAAINTAQGDVILSHKQKLKLAGHRNYINRLIKKGEPIQKKRKLINQKGGSIIGFILPTILSAVLSSLGSNFFQK